MTGTEQGINMVISSPSFWLALLIAAAASVALAVWRRKNRKHQWYTPQLPVIVAIGVASTIIPFGVVISWTSIVILMAAFAVTGFVQWYECVTWEGEQEKEQARRDAHDSQEKMAGRS